PASRGKLDLPDALRACFGRIRIGAHALHVSEPETDARDREQQRDGECRRAACRDARHGPAEGAGGAMGAMSVGRWRYTGSFALTIPSFCASSAMRFG